MDSAKSTQKVTFQRSTNTSNDNHKVGKLDLNGIDNSPTNETHDHSIPTVRIDYPHKKIEQMLITGIDEYFDLEEDKHCQPSRSNSPSQYDDSYKTNSVGDDNEVTAEDFLETEEKEKKTIKDIKTGNVSNVSLNYQPWSVEACYNTTGYKTKLKSIIKIDVYQKAKRVLPSKVLIVSMLGRYDTLKMYRMNGKFLGNITLKCCCQFICDIACHNQGQKLFISDARQNCIFVTDLDGNNAAKFNTDIVFKDIRGLHIDESQVSNIDNGKKENRLFVCDGTLNQIFIYSLDTNQLIVDIYCANQSGVSNCSWNQSAEELWVTNQNTDLITVYGGDSYQCVRQCPDEEHSYCILFPSFIAHSDCGSTFIASWHCVTQLDKEGNIVSRYGKHGARVPTGNVTSRSASRHPHGYYGLRWLSEKETLVVCDCDNQKLKFICLNL